MISIEHIPIMRYGDRPRIGCVYSITNITTKRTYIGGTIINRQRINIHLSSLRRGTHTNKKLQQDFNLYGEDDFRINLLKTIEHDGGFTGQNQVRNVERELIEKLNPYYNQIYLKREKTN